MANEFWPVIYCTVPSSPPHSFISYIFSHHPPFPLPIDRYSTRHHRPRKARNNLRTQPTRREFSTVLSSSPQALSSGTSIHSPAASHPVNKRILARLHHDPCRIRRANRHRQAIAIARVAHLRTSAWLVAMSPSPAATLLASGNSLGRSRWAHARCASLSLLSSVAQLHFPIRSPLWYLGKQATEAIFAVEAAVTGTRPAFALRVYALIVARAAITTPLAKFPGQKLANGKEPADVLRHSNSTRRTKVSRAYYSIRPES